MKTQTLYIKVQLRDKNERLFTKLGYFESRLGHLAGSKTDLSSKLVQSEEEKLKVFRNIHNTSTVHDKMPLNIYPYLCVLDIKGTCGGADKRQQDTRAI